MLWSLACKLAHLQTAPLCCPTSLSTTATQRVVEETAMVKVSVLVQVQVQVQELVQELVLSRGQQQPAQGQGPGPEHAHDLELHAHEMVCGHWLTAESSSLELPWPHHWQSCQARRRPCHCWWWW